VLTGARTTAEGAATVDPGRIRRITSAGGQTIVTVEQADGLHDVLVPIAPDRRAAQAAVAGLWRVQWVRLHLDVPAPIARLAGTTRHPHVRSVPLSAALALAEQGVPAYLSREGD
jgi:hypothetical protein